MRATSELLKNRAPGKGAGETSQSCKPPPLDRPCSSSGARVDLLLRRGR